jgi:hypothetical protein
MTRVSPRGILRSEVQDLLHECFNYTQTLESYAAQLADPDSGEDRANIASEIGALTARLRDLHEELRARVLPLLG